MTTSARLIARLREEGVSIPDGAVLRRTYAGHWQRSEGAWSWGLNAAEGHSLYIGSQWPATTLLRCEIEVTKDTFGQLHIDPKQVRDPDSGWWVTVPREKRKKNAD